ncbi:MAG: hypothetical protein B6244_07400 [Candidatus Cloacimonetes bacterium 4572_55]|nr:MAG: hypothetical protein B6244_07400 [Candidatus Cloacimonetes bacterium 4572_55]
MQSNPKARVLIAIISSQEDMEIARDKNWYRIPEKSVKKWLNKCWPPEWIAFYQTKFFGKDAYSIRYFAQVFHIEQVYRWELFPDEPENEKTHSRYFRLWFGPLLNLSDPIFSRRWRRIIFICTIWKKFISAVEINDLYHGSKAEDRLWAELKRKNIPAEREEFIRIQNHFYALDFSIYCQEGKINVETDGEIWHKNETQLEKDRQRDEILSDAGWKVLRFDTKLVAEETAPYTLSRIVKNIDELGGPSETSITKGNDDDVR